jgi:hypothetical protein
MIVDHRGIRVPKPSDLLQGTLDLLILKTVARDPLHGWAIAKRIQLLSRETLSVGQGSLTRRSTGWNSRAGFAPSGGPPIWDAPRSSTR